MKRLMIMRHAEAQDPEAGQGDKNRMLSRKGRHDMERLHLCLQAENLMPQFALASDATRTQATLTLVTGDDFDGYVELTPELYNADANRIIETAQLLDDRYDSALLVAHNPGVHLAIFNLLNAAGLAEFQSKTGGSYKSGTLAILECPIAKWAELKSQANNLAKLFVPD